MIDRIRVLSGQRIEMRDTTQLAADVYLPVDEGRYPTILLRTPYGNGLDEFNRLQLQRYVDAGYAVVYQLVRGCLPSEGEFKMFFNEQDDGFDTVEWVASQIWCNGRVAMDGGSYLGTAQYLAARALPPHLVAILPSVPAGDYFNEVPYIGGALLFDHVVNWSASQDGIDVEAREQEILALMKTVRPLQKLGRGIGITSSYYYSVIDRETFGKALPDLYYSDEDFRRIAHLPVMTVTGWFDGDQAGSLYYWEGIERHFPETSNSFLIIGPWEHKACYLGGSNKKGLMHFGEEATIDILAERVRFFDHYLQKGSDSRQMPDRVRLFVTGINEWRSYCEYPPRCTLAAFYLHSGGNANTRQGDGLLNLDKPTLEPVDCFVFDPADPVVYQEYGEDVSETELRPDILVYSSAILDRSLEIIGQLNLVLYAASDALDTDFAVRIIDVHPDGTAVNLSHSRGVIRARYRNSFLDEELLQVGKVEKYQIRLNDLGHVFDVGHRVRLEVTSSLFPLFDPNPNTGGAIHTETSQQVAQQTVHHDSKYPSHLLLPITGP